MSITTPIKVKTFTRSFVLWLSNGFGFCGNVGKIALPTAKRNICKPSKREALFSPPCICRINPKIYGRQGAEDYCHISLRETRFVVSVCIEILVACRRQAKGTPSAESRSGLGRTFRIVIVSFGLGVNPYIIHQ